MTYYSDDARHLVCVPYTVEDLHLMAIQLGIKACWFHGGRWPHYDIPKRRIEEIRSQTTRVTSKELLALCGGPGGRAGR